MEIVFLGQQDWDHCWTGKQQLATRLARRGHRVLYVDPEWSSPPRRPGARLRQLAAHPAREGLREVGPAGLRIFTYRRAAWIGWRANVRRRQAALRRVQRDLHLVRPLVLALRPDVGDTLRALRPRASLYYGIDEWTGFGGLTEAARRRLRADEEALLREVDVALAISPRLLERFRRVQPASHLLESGADVEHFAPARLAAARPHPALAELPRPRLGLVGQIDERVDQELLVALARARPGWQIALVGRRKPGVDLSALDRERNVHLQGYVPYEELPGAMRELDVALLPYRESELTHSCCPLKVYESLAAGLPVVARPLQGLGSAAPGVALASSPEDFAAAVEAALREPAQARAQRLQLARTLSWDARVDALEEHLEEALRLGARRRGAVPPRERALRGADLPRLRELPERFHDYGLPAREDGGGERVWRAAFAALRAAGWVRWGARVAGRALTGRRPPAVRRILVVRDAWLGDLLALVPALEELREAYPGARIALGVQPGMRGEELLAGAGLVDEVLALDFLSQPTRRAQLAGALRLFAAGFDALVTGLGYFTRREAFLCGAPLRVGPYDGHPRQALLTRALPSDLARHEADLNRDVAALLHGGATDAPRPPRLRLDGTALRRGADALLAELGMSAASPLLVVHPGSAKASRRWPAERFAAVLGATLQRRPALHVVLTGVAAEGELAERVRACLPAPLAARIRNAAGRSDLLALAGLLERADAVLSNDTGVMHLARTLGTPLVALLGPENDRRWGPHPFGPGPAVALRSVVPCAPCSLQACEALHCMRSLEVERVERALEQLLSAGRPARNGHVALRRDVRRVGFAELAEAGHDLPLVSVVLIPEELVAGLLPPGRAPARPAEELLRDALAQTYPRVEVLLLAGCEGPSDAELLARLDGAPVSVVRVPKDHATAAWGTLLRAARGELIAPLEGDGAWEPERLATHVAELLRRPELDLVRARRGAPPAAGDVTLRRAALERALARWRGGYAPSPAETFFPALLEQSSVGFAQAPQPRGGVRGGLVVAAGGG